MTENISCCQPALPWYKKKLVIASLLGVLSIGITAGIQQSWSLVHYFVSIIHEMWLAILIGLIIGGIIDYTVPRMYVEKLLAQPKKRTLLLAAFLGIILSTCSHGVLAIGMQLYKKGAAVPSLIVLLTAAPWANLPITILLIKFFGWQSLYLIFAAVIVSLITGFIFQLLDNKHALDHCPAFDFNHHDSFSIRKDIKKRWQHYTLSYSQLKTDLKGIGTGAIDLANVVLAWFFVALIMASYIGHFVPATIFEGYFSNSVLGMINTLIAASVIEVCSEGSSVLAFELYKQTQSLSNVLVFLLAGVATDYTEIGLIWTTIGKRTALLLPIVSIPLILVMGLVFLYLF